MSRRLAPTKAERMELRRATGNRTLPVPPAPAVRGAAYLIAHACFACRASWRRKPGTSPAWPQGGSPLREMGRYRTYPDAERFPDRLRDLAAFIRRNPDHPFRINR